ncbi:MAG TPA: hypothetical protein DCL38_02570 [Lachnospiraceae bacterium]|nr:hypothetical protein [Lachnospiraceae bacterium]
MDGFRDRFGSRYDRSSGRSTASGSRSMDRDRGAVDRGNNREYDYGGHNDYAPRDDYNSRRGTSQPGMSMGMDNMVGQSSQGGGVSGRQLEIIRDYFDEAKDDSKEILHAVDNNAKMLDRGLDLLGEIKEKTEKNVGEQKTIDLTGPLNSIQELGKANKEDIITAIAGNTQLLNAIKEQVLKNSDAISGIASEGSDGEGINKEELEGYFSELTDHVHKENVKCYRNVAGALEEYEKKSDEKGSGIGVVKIFSIIQLALTVLNVVLLALYIFRVI